LILNKRALGSFFIMDCIIYCNKLRLYNIYGGGKKINNIQKYNINNGFVEGENNKIKVIKKLSYVLTQKSWTQDWRSST
jgi:hypothetical protein